MSFVFSSSYILPSPRITHFKLDLKTQRDALSIPTFTFGLCKLTRNLPLVKTHKISKKKFIARECTNPNNEVYTEESDITYGWGDQLQGEIEDSDSPWEGAIVYKRNPSISHLEYCTTLERLGLVKLSSELSISRASVMGLRVTKAVKDFPLGTPVLISIDVTRKRHKLRLDGIVRTVISLACNRCGEPAAECIFSNFSLLLNEERIEESDVINMGLIFGEDKYKTSGTIRDEDGEDGEEDDDGDSIDIDDCLYFPPEEREIDISKQIRDTVHIEITINALCDPSCKGLCLKCGSNLNTGSCNCSKQEVKEKGYGPLGGLRKQMQQK